MKKERPDSKGGWVALRREPKESEGRHLARQVAEIAEAARDAFDAAEMTPAEAEELTETMRDLMLLASGIRDRGAYLARSILSARAALRDAMSRSRSSNPRSMPGLRPEVGSALREVTARGKSSARSARWLEVRRQDDRAWVRGRVYQVAGDAGVDQITDEAIDAVLDAGGDKWEALNEFLGLVGLEKWSGAALRQAVAVAKRTEPVSEREERDRAKAKRHAR